MLTPLEPDEAIRQAAVAQALIEQLGRVVLGQPDAVRDSVAALVARGHVLLEGVPGTAKTLLVRAMGLALFADKLPAEKAAEWGLIWDVIEDAAFAAGVDDLRAGHAVGPAGVGLAVGREHEHEVQRSADQQQPPRFAQQGGDLGRERLARDFLGCGPGRGLFSQVRITVSVSKNYIPWPTRS